MSKTAHKWGVVREEQDYGPCCLSSGGAELHLSHLDYSQRGSLSALVTMAQWCVLTFASRLPGLGPAVLTAELRGQRGETLRIRVLIYPFFTLAPEKGGKSVCTRYYVARSGGWRLIVVDQAGLIVPVLEVRAIRSALRVGTCMHKTVASWRCGMRLASCATSRKAVVRCFIPLHGVGQGTAETHH